MFYSFPYLLLYTFNVLLFIYERIYTNNNVLVRNRIRFLCGVSFFLFFGFRGYVGSDWFNYELSYSLTSWSQWLLSDYELGYSAIAKTFAYFKIDYFYFVSFLTGIQVLLFDRFISRYSYISVPLSYIIIIALFPILIIDLQRNFISILIVINAIPFLESNQKLKFYLYVTVSMLFHLSGIVFFFLPFIDRSRFSQKVVLVLFLVGLVVYFLQINFYQEALSIIGKAVGGRLEYLINQSVREDEVSYGITVGIIEKIALFLALLLFYPSVMRRAPLMIKVGIIYLLVYLYFSTSQSFINRFANLFFWGYLVIYSVLFFALKKYKLRSLFVWFLLLFCFVRVYVGYDNVIYKYVNVLVEHENKMERINNRNLHYENR
ncbi:EpsG family protein [Pseudoxanthomonas sp. SGD-10]|nr:EpsG family protein [Pseudoxanthomonas sp. SGD-10]